MDKVVEFRKRGHWIERKIAGGIWQYICSECGDYHAFKNIHSMAAEFNDNYNYCRKCGAYMRGGKSE